MVNVVCGLILNNQNEVLMTLRRKDQLRPSMWEMPGGKREAEETDEMCLVRELKEELGIIVEVEPRAISIAYFEWEQRVICTLYRAIIKAGNPQPLDAVAMAHYEMTHALRHVPMCPTSYLFYADVIRYIKERKSNGDY